MMDTSNKRSARSKATVLSIIGIVVVVAIVGIASSNKKEVGRHVAVQSKADHVLALRCAGLSCGHAGQCDFTSGCACGLNGQCIPSPSLVGIPPFDCNYQSCGPNGGCNTIEACVCGVGGQCLWKSSLSSSSSLLGSGRSAPPHVIKCTLFFQRNCGGHGTAMLGVPNHQACSNHCREQLCSSFIASDFNGGMCWNSPILTQPISSATCVLFYQQNCVGFGSPIISVKNNAECLNLCRTNMCSSVQCSAYRNGACQPNVIQHQPSAQSVSRPVVPCVLYFSANCKGPGTNILGAPTEIACQNDCIRTQCSSYESMRSGYKCTNNVVQSSGAQSTSSVGTRHLGAWKYIRPNNPAVIDAAKCALTAIPRIPEISFEFVFNFIAAEQLVQGTKLKIATGALERASLIIPPPAPVPVAFLFEVFVPLGGGCSLTSYTAFTGRLSGTRSGGVGLAKSVKEDRLLGAPNYLDPNSATAKTVSKCALKEYTKNIVGVSYALDYVFLATEQMFGSSNAYDLAFVATVTPVATTPGSNPASTSALLLMKVSTMVQPPCTVDSVAVYGL